MTQSQPHQPNSSSLQSPSSQKGTSSQQGNSAHSLRCALKDCMIRDRFRLSKRIHGANKIKNPDAKAKVFDEIAMDIAKSMMVVQNRSLQKPHIEYPDILPVSQKRDDIADAIANNQVVIIAGETGSGKTTQIPKICSELGRGRTGLIGHTQPRRLAARSVANRIAEEMQTPLGEYVGYKVRFNDQISDNTQIKLMTDGILLAEIQHDRFLNQYDTIIIDEAHERSLNIDFIMGYLKELLPKRPDLKIIITSATIDPERFSNHFNQAPIIEVSGRTYPVDVRYRPLNPDDAGSDEKREDHDQLEGIFQAVDELCDEPGLGDILIFMNGEREIRDTADALTKRAVGNRSMRDTEVVPLYARLSSAEQNKIFQSHTGRRIVLATNVAETSLTVPGIKYVIDPGTARISRYSYRTKVQRLPIEAISQASANQRKGRCGRVSDGICIRLYSEDDFNTRDEFTDPEIIRTNLASVILQMTSLGLGDIDAFPFVEAPDKRNIQDGVRLLEELGAINPNSSDPKKRLTATGRKLARLPIDPRLARMVLEAVKYNCLKEVMIIAAALSIQDPRERPSDKQQASDEKHKRFFHEDSDFLTFVNVWDYLKEQQQALSSNQFRKQCKQDYLNYLRVREWQDVYFQIHQAMREMDTKLNSEPANYEAVHSALLVGLLSHIGMKDAEKSEYQGARNARFHIFPASGLFKKQPKWIMSAELVETSKLWGRIIAKIQPEWIEPLAPHLIKRSYSEPHWSKKQAAVMAHEKVMLYGIPIVPKRTINYGPIDPTLCREIFIRSALVEGDWETKHHFFKQNRQLLKEVEELEHKSRRRDILVDDDELFDFYDQRVDTEVVSGRHFDAWWKKARQTEAELLNFEKAMLFRNDASHVTDLDYPNFWHQNGLKLKLSYQFEPGQAAIDQDRDGVTVHIPLPILNQISQEGFDWQIPGLRHELVVSLIKSLPKTLRRNFVPAPNYADAFLSRVSSQEKAMELPLLDALEKELRRITGVEIKRENWQLEQIPDHLKVTFRAVDHRKRKLKEHSDLYELKESLKEKVQQTLSKVADDDIEQQGLHTWSFGELPTVYQQKRGGFEVKAYPALVDSKDSVEIKLFETEQEQQQAMKAGQRRLILLNVPSPIKYLHSNLPNKSKLGLYFNPYGRVLDLIDDCIACGIDKLIEQKGGLVWQPEQFEALKEHVRAELGDTVVDIAEQVETILTTAFSINKKLKGKVDFTMAFALSDIKAQVEGLIFKGFATECGWKRLPDILRYMKAIERRMEKLPIDPNRDRLHMLKVESAVKDYKQLLSKIPKGVEVPENVKEIRWMLEELRVSFFAQQLGTPYPVSDKRVKIAIDAC
ncbi:ATP-dependent RNA helicase HrpA [Vibrio sp. S11_S32]|uniref:ATP-dependent RNA helicase HrpA n=1 Tax=Vibrio sp. S11_S32 TaxID=2720225 RepID=UPI0016809EAE|nr:ATP-dependent RNA helicase HrpA [Vibrio sp. S11_S32]MBD1575654.1 ATP-dependent RNA helicase HrpA [Vibrio sp. S11_S32]